MQRTIVRQPLPAQRQASPISPARSSMETVVGDVSKPLRGRVVGVLVAIDGPLEGEVFRIFDGENTLGRDEQKCQVHLDNERISREHARIIHSDRTFVIKPLNEKNPTIVNEERVAEGIELNDGDQLKLGRTLLVFRSV